MIHTKARRSFGDRLPQSLQTPLNAVAFTLIPIITCLMVESLFQRPTDDMKPMIRLLNALLYLLLLVLTTGITGSFKWGTRLFTLLSWFIGTANYAVIAFRSTPIMPWDLASAHTALSVADNYRFPFEQKWILFTAFSVFMLVAASFLTWKVCSWKQYAVTLLMALLLFGSGYYLASRPVTTELYQLDQTLFNAHYMARHNGFLANFVHSIYYLDVPEPKDYSVAQVQAVTEAYVTKPQELTPVEREEGREIETLERVGGSYASAIQHYLEIANRPATTTLEAGEPPDIIVVMNESFADMSVIRDLGTNLPYLSFTHGLETDTIKGDLHVSVVGGNTASSEFEYLTGASMAFLPSGSIAYQQYIDTPIPNLASYLSHLGYRTTAMHPFYERGWMRDKVYPLLGFESMKFIDDFEDARRLRNYVSDEGFYTQILRDLHDAPAEEPQFIFGVTMQNHGGYTEDFVNFRPEVVMTDPPSSKALNTYLSLIRESDLQLGSFLATLKAREQPTLVVFFGDHQPNDYTARPLTQGLEGDALEARRRVTPYLIWANYDIEEDQDVTSSIPYLAPATLEYAGLPMSPWHRFLSDTHQEIPVLNDAFYGLNDGTRHRTDGKLPATLEAYRQLQYNLLFDLEHQVETLFLP